MRPTIKVQRSEKTQVSEILSAPKRATDINYARKNVDQLRKKQEDNRRRKEFEQNNPPKQPFKIKRFQNVQSVVNKGPNEGRQPSKAANREPAPSEPKIVTYDADYSPPEPAPISNQPDFIHTNAVQAIGSVPKKNQPLKKQDAKALNPNYGKVPHYLEEFNKKREQDQERKRIQEELANCPPGMKLMPDAERVETLEMLHKGKEEVFQAINKLPIASNTGAVQRRRKEYEEKLNEIESAIKTFSRPRVYVAL